MKKLLLVIDFQHDFVDGTLGFKDAVKLYEPILERINIAALNNQDIIFTKDTHYQDYLDTVEGKNLPIEHCIKGTIGHSLYKELENISKNYLVIEKETFPSKEFYEIFKDKIYDEIEIIGVVTNICVLSNAVIIKSIYPNARIIVNSKLCASNDKVLEKESYDILKNLHIVVN